MHHGFIKVTAVTPKIKVADPAYNGEVIAAAIERDRSANLMVFPELCITGYTCGDLFLQDALLQGAREALVRIASAAQGDTVYVLGLPLEIQGRLFNCAAVVQSGRVLGVVPKTHIPNYAEFYERRHFASGSEADFDTVDLGPLGLVPFGTDLLFCAQELPSFVLGVEICEDLWVPDPPSVRQAMAGATVIANPSASDEIVAKDDYRRMLVSSQSARLVCGYVYADAGEGESSQDLVYTGHDLIAENGAVLAESQDISGAISTEIDLGRLAYERRKMGTFTGGGSNFRRIPFSQPLRETELTRPIAANPFVPADTALREQRCDKILTLQSLGLKKRLQHTGSAKAVLGISGGLDSTLALLVTARAMDMLGKKRSDIVAVTMPCFGTTSRTKSNAERLAEHLGATLRVVDITRSVLDHFADIGHDPDQLNVVFENSQARERTQVLMDIANAEGALVIGTGDLSELALGWATYNGDHMSMYGVNASVPKTLVRHLVRYYADTCRDAQLRDVLLAVLDTPVSPELLPAENGEISQKTEELVGPYELHDFFLYYAIRWGFAPEKVYRLARYAFAGSYEDGEILKWLKIFYRRFFGQQFKRSCLPDGPKVGTLTLSPRGDWRMPSDASSALWLLELGAL